MESCLLFFPTVINRTLSQEEILNVIKNDTLDQNVDADDDDSDIEILEPTGRFTEFSNRNGGIIGKFQIKQEIILEIVGVQSR
jgi:hypothetical protein